MHGLIRAEAHRARKKALAFAAGLALPVALWAWSVAYSEMPERLAVLMPSIIICAVAGIFGAEPFLEDLARGTATFTLTRPLGRATIWRVKTLTWLGAAAVLSLPLGILPYCALLYVACSGGDEAVNALCDALTPDVVLLGPTVWFAGYFTGGWLGTLGQPRGGELHGREDSGCVGCVFFLLLFGFLFYAMAWSAMRGSWDADLYPWVVVAAVTAITSACASREAFVSGPVFEFQARPRQSSLVAIAAAIFLWCLAFLGLAWLGR